MSFLFITTLASLGARFTFSISKFLISNKSPLAWALNNSTWIYNTDLVKLFWFSFSCSGNTENFRDSPAHFHCSKFYHFPALLLSSKCFDENSISVVYLPTYSNSTLWQIWLSTLSTICLHSVLLSLTYSKFLWIIKDRSSLNSKCCEL